MLRRVLLRELTEELSVTVVEPNVSGALRSAELDVVPLASVGPLLFFERRLSLDAFGAHGRTEVQAPVWDLRAAGVADVLTERERSVIASRVSDSAADRLLEEGRAAGLEGSIEEVELVAVRPRWTLDGLTVHLQMAAEACYACSDGRWSDYTRSVEVLSDPLPERLAEHALLPRWVRSALERHPDAELRGYSDVQGAAPVRILETLHR